MGSDDIEMMTGQPELSTDARYRHKTVVMFCVALAAGIFIVDVASLPLGVAAGVAYVAVVLISLWLPGRRFPIYVAGGVSVLTLLGFIFSEPAGTPPWMVVTNRVLAIVVIWVTAIGGNWLILAKRRKLEDALRLEKRLADKLQADQEAALRIAERDAKRARNAKTRFLESASNDMRHHLQTLSLLNGALRKTVTQPKAQEMFAMQGEALGHLADLLNTLLELSKLESGSVEVELAEVRIQDVFQQLRDEFEHQARAKGLELQFNSQAEVANSDVELLTRVVRLLVANAVRYTKQGTVSVDCQRDDGGLRITVHDTGIGIAPDQLARIFDEFYRVESEPAGRNAGLGLGLSIVERSLNLLGAKVDVESTCDQGSSFSFVVPAAMD